MGTSRLRPEPRSLRSLGLRRRMRKIGATCASIKDAPTFRRTYQPRNSCKIGANRAARSAVAFPSEWRRFAPRALLCNKDGPGPPEDRQNFGSSPATEGSERHAKNAPRSTGSCRADKWTKCGDFEVSSGAAGGESGQRGYWRSAGGSSSLHVTSCSAVMCTGYSARKQTSTRIQRL
jgi:hypothetical protein